MPEPALARPLRARLEPVVGTVLARGPGYEPQRRGPLLEVGSVGGYFVDLRAKTTARAARTPESLQPAALAQLALGWWDRGLAGEDGARGVFLDTVALLELRAEHGTDGLRWPYSVPVSKYRLSPPWCSAMAQGQAASVLARAYLVTGGERFRRLALEAIRPLLATASTDLVTVTAGGPVLEEAPSDPPAHILNGWIFALWGLWDVAVGLRHDEAGVRFRASASCLAGLLHRYDVGWWTRYSLYPHRLADLAKPFYHDLHTTQAEVMFLLTSRPEFRDAAARWRRYDGALRRSCALTQKAAFVVAGGRGR
jgi:heparosan-N-sulfate-glucuronate 5-epimerase